MARGVRRPSSADVARLAGVSRTTVSFVLNDTPGKSIPEATRERVIRAARQLQYVPDARARSSALVRHRSIGFFITHASWVSSDAFVARLLEGMTPVLNAHRFGLVLQGLRLRQANYLALARADRVDGVVLMNPHGDDAGLAELLEAGIPAAVIGTVASRDVFQVDVDNRSAAAEAVRHLLALGHRRVAMITHAPVSYHAAAGRVAGWRDALVEAGLAPSPALLREGNLTEESGYRAMRALLAARPRPTAVFAGNDVVAFGALQALRDARVAVPAELSLVGFDDDLFSRFLNPPLTTVASPAARLGALAARRLIATLSGRPAPRGAALVRAPLAVRGSTAPPPERALSAAGTTRARARAAPTAGWTSRAARRT